MAVKEHVALTIEDLIRLDNYGHRPLGELTRDELNEYANLLEMRRQEVLERIQELRKGGK